MKHAVHFTVHLDGVVLIEEQEIYELRPLEHGK
jgi:hypothetical protein